MFFSFIVLGKGWDFSFGGENEEPFKHTHTHRKRASGPIFGRVIILGPLQRDKFVVPMTVACKIIIKGEKKEKRNKKGTS